ncbi:Rieske (2Fe-2S) protein [Sulfitobacter mediterraneus]|uniref:Rieske (2Fe-2S) protein n=1 Tax=Sulfitobacter mediterraneus TaxID=83219 RepID=UPI0021A43425|nr:Rieske 2Fe-2S domain-containing protein [Sulfitobacter mediterraneus]UWR13387.1 Rieske 2Fe-2S domain-containing protein [Sulfitobacter mediterraneus]
MRDTWKSYRGAPDLGTEICSLQDVPEGGTHCLEIDGFPLLLVRVGDALQGYVNACPHQYLPLDHKGDKLISADKTILRCTNHAAGFSVQTGEGVEGLGLGDCLDAVPIRVSEKTIFIAE